MNNHTSVHTDRWVGVAFALLGAALFWSSMGMRSGAYLGDPGPAFFPRVISILIILFAIILIFRARESNQDSQAGPVSDDASNSGGLRRFILTSVAALLYIPVISLIGFVFATSVYLITAIWILGPRKWTHAPVIIGFAVLFTLSLAFALTRWLGVAPPQGILS